MTDPTSCCRVHGGYCQRCDVLVGLPGLHVTGVERNDAGLRVRVESGPAGVVGCPSCGVVAHAHGRQTVELRSGPVLHENFRGKPPRIVTSSYSQAASDGSTAKVFIPGAVPFVRNSR